MREFFLGGSANCIVLLRCLQGCIVSGCFRMRERWLEAASRRWALLGLAEPRKICSNRDEEAVKG